LSAIVPKIFSNYFLTPSGSVKEKKNQKSIDKIVIAMTPDNNKVHFLTTVTSLLIPQRMNSFNKEEKVNSGLSFRNMQATFPAFYLERPIPSLTCQISHIVIFGCQCCHLGYTSQLLLF
jgi:hypothetical protein